MTQYTKFTKNISYNENYSNLPTNNGLTPPLNHNLTKTSSRGSNMTGLSANGSPALTLNSNLPKPVLITNLNSSNISSLIKNERIKSSTIARSVTMRYNTNTKLQFDSNNSNNFTNVTAANLNPNQAIQANHFHYNRRSLQQPQQPIQQQQQQQQQPISVDSSNLQSKKEYLSLLSNIHRSQSIKINRDKTNLSGYFSGLVSNRDSRLQTNGSINLNGNNNSTNLSTNGNSSTNYLQLNTKYNRKHQPFSLRNNNNSSSMYNTTNNNSNNSINLTGSSDGNYLTNNSVTVNTNGLLNSKVINNNSSNNRLSEISKNSISLDNVYNGLDLIIANEQKYNNHKLLEANNKSNTNLGYSSTINSKKSSQNQQGAYTSNNSNSFNYTNSNYLIDNSNRVINELNLLKSNNKKRIQKLEIDDEITQNSTTLNNHTEEINKELSSRRSNHLKLNDPNENEENNIINNLLDEAEHYHNTKNGLNTTINDNSLLKATNYFAKKVKPSKSDMRHVKLNDETIYNNKINKLDLIDQLELYNQQQKPSINYLKAAKPLAATSPQNVTAHSPLNTNTRYKTEMQQQRALVEYNKNAIDSQSKLNHSRSQLTRNHSRLSHITRDINDSYAYTNVQQYIEENDLMPPEKAHSIKKWVIEVNNSFDEWEKKTVEKHIEDSFI